MILEGRQVVRVPGGAVAGATPRVFRRQNCSRQTGAYGPTFLGLEIITVGSEQLALQGCDSTLPSRAVKYSAFTTPVPLKVPLGH